MERIGVRELRQNASKYLERVKAGEEFEVTDRGEPVAMLVPRREDVIERLIASGRLRPPERPTGALLEPPLPSGGLSVSEELQRLREDRL